ncbi:AAA family ATPase [Kribbella catacumbae]|uniref:AAA family ATPase n=1 Tax=Kribbella catacumbae TaxID=460086 RepID=UPI000361DE44|nr:P-loop NTPase [Kribbella catacumbae]
MADCRIVTVFAAKGGCGKTTVATNLAAVLHDRGGHRVCLVDLDLEYGDAASMLGLRPERSMVDALAVADQLTPETVATLMTNYLPGFDCLLAPTRPGEARLIPATLVSRLLAVLPLSYDFVVVDTPSHFTPHVLAALDAADHQILVTTPERPALKNLRATLDMLDLLPYDRAARSIVVNRSDAGSDLPAGLLDELIRSPIAGRLPAWDDVPASINRGEPLAAAQPDHAVSQAIRQLAAAFLSDGRCSRDPPAG